MLSASTSSARCGASGTRGAAAPSLPSCRAPAVRQLVVANFIKSSPPSSPVTDPATEPAGTSFRSAVDVMLNRASSSIRRGPCTCLSCRGGGTISCPHCKGAGVLSAQEVERGQLLKGVVQKFRDAVGLKQGDAPYTGSLSLRTNRCTRCHGQGRLLCELCTGSGLRYPHLAKDHWRQCAGQPGAEAGDECPIE